MESLSNYKLALVSLASLLGKLLKIMAHSDPTAKAKQTELYQKYQANLKLFSKSAKGHWQWQSLLDYLRSLEEELGPDLETRQTIKKKLVKDLSALMVDKAAMPEFNAAPAVAKPKKRVQKKKVQPNPLDSQKQAEADKMAQAMLDPKQMEGAGQLRGLIDAINKLGPDALENQINKHYKKN